MAPFTVKHKSQFQSLEMLSLQHLVPNSLISLEALKTYVFYYSHFSGKKIMAPKVRIICPRTEFLATDVMFYIQECSSATNLSIRNAHNDAGLFKMIKPQVTIN